MTPSRLAAYLSNPHITCARILEASVFVRTVDITLELLLPELPEPGVVSVRFGAEREVVAVEAYDGRGVQLDGDAPGRLLFQAVHHVRTHGPAVAGIKHSHHKPFPSV